MCSFSSSRRCFLRSAILGCFYGLSFHSFSASPSTRDLFNFNSVYRNSNVGRDTLSLEEIFASGFWELSLLTLASDQILREVEGWENKMIVANFNSAFSRTPIKNRGKKRTLAIFLKGSSIKFTVETKVKTFIYICTYILHNICNKNVMQRMILRERNNYRYKISYMAFVVV